MSCQLSELCNFTCLERKWNTHHALPHCAGCSFCSDVFLLPLCWTCLLVASITVGPEVSDKSPDEGDSVGSKAMTCRLLDFGYHKSSARTVHRNLAVKADLMGVQGQP